MKMITSDSWNKHNIIMNNPLIQGHTGSASKLAVCALSSRDKWQKSFFHHFDIAHFHFVSTTKFCITIGSISPGYHSSLKRN